MLLVYEYMPNGSLDKLLIPKAKVLEWKKRYKIVEGVAAGLAYLHHGCEQQVIHRDVKASNVLLDRHYDPRLADFGLARLIDHNKALQTMTMAGTLGYVAPEMYYTGRASSKSDVYSFGVLLLVVACGRPPLDQRRLPHQEVMLLNLVWKMQEQGEVLEAADPRLDGAFDATEMRRVLHLGLLCCFPDPEVRPTMRFCEHVLRGEMALPPVATSKPPLFHPVSFSSIRIDESTSHSMPAKADSSTQYISAKSGSFSANQQSNVSSPFSSVCGELSGPSITASDTPGSSESFQN
ncbi:hypothetical protein O6H91_Y058700 [Diphasiastrum complanatum]|nr:hypothetical protein O6H91_Y058700 [Diphasiastrum complanatum]